MRTALLQRYAAPVKAFWSVRNPRERRLLAIGLTVAGLGLFYLLLIEPALQGRQELQQRLPALRQQVAELRALAQEAAELPEQAAAQAEEAPLTRSGVEAALQAKGLAPQSLDVTAGTVRVQLAAASFAALVAWLGEMQGTAGLAVSEARIVAQTQPDTVDATLLLQKRNNE